MADLRILDRTPCTGCSRPMGPSPPPPNTTALLRVLRQRYEVFKDLLNEATSWEDMLERQLILDNLAVDIEILETFDECYGTGPSWYFVFDADDPPRYMKAMQMLAAEIPGALDLRNHLLAGGNRSKLKRCLSIYEVSHRGAQSPVYHEFDITSPSSVFRHYDILKGGSPSHWPLLVIDQLRPQHIVLLGQLLGIHPSAWISHMWRDLKQSAPEFGLSLLENPGVGQDKSHVYFLPAIQQEAAPRSEPFDFGRFAFQSSLETVGTKSWCRHWMSHTKSSKHEDVAKFAAAARPRLCGGQLSWTDEHRRVKQDTIDVIITTSFQGLENRPGVGRFGLVIQTPVTGHTVVDEDFKVSSDSGKTFEPGPGVPVSKLVKRALHIAQHPGSQLSCTWSFKTFFLPMEISSMVAAVIGARDSIHNDIGALRYKLQPEDQVYWNLATRSQTKRILLTRLKPQITTYQCRVRQELTIGAHRVLLDALREGLEIIEVLMPMLDEYDRALQEIRDEEFRNLQIQLTTTQLEESRKAIKQADTVARLTILAFIYIPISCVCGIFGMNLIEAPSGYPSWVFGVTLTIVLITTVAIAMGGRLYLFSLRLLFYVSKALVYDKIVFYPLRKKPVIWIALRNLIELPDQIRRRYRRAREKLLSFIEQVREAEPPEERIRRHRG